MQNFRVTWFFQGDPTQNTFVIPAENEQSAIAEVQTIIKNIQRINNKHDQVYHFFVFRI